MIYLFKKESWLKQKDLKTAFCFEVDNFHNNRMYLNKKATKLIERENHIEVNIADWYLKNSGSYKTENIERMLNCEQLQRDFRNEQKTKN